MWLRDAFAHNYSSDPFFTARKGLHHAGGCAQASGQTAWPATGTSQWIRAAAMPFQRSGSCKASDWKKLLEVGLEYCFADVLLSQCSEAFWSLVKVLRKLLEATCDVDPTWKVRPPVWRGSCAS